MRRSALISIGIHVFILVFMSMNFSNPFKRAPLTSNTMVIEFSQIADKTAAPKLAPEPEKKKEPEKPKEEIKEEPKDLPPPPETESLPEESKPTEKTPETPKEKETKKPDPPKKEAVPLPDKSKTKPEPKKEEPKKKEKPAEKKKEDNKKKKNKQPEKAQVNLKKNKPNAKKDAKKDNKKTSSLDDLLKEVSDSPSNDSGARADTISDTVTASQIDAIRSTIRKCWYIPAGHKTFKDTVVDLKMELSEDGTVIKADIVDKSRMNSDPDFRIAAEAAHRAVLDPECNPLPIPKGKHKDWKDLEMSFNPKDMFN
jgi:outer membrane biosynthesis protein TonB